MPMLCVIFAQLGLASEVYRVSPTTQVARTRSTRSMRTAPATAPGAPGAPGALSPSDS
jgi:hypothetical protein